MRSIDFGLALMPRWDDPPDRWRAEVAVATELGFDFIGIGDSQSVALDSWMILGEVARQTDQALLGPCVTNTITRHPAVTVGAASTLQRLSGGRATILLGRGASAADNLGRRSDPVRHSEEYVRTVRALLDGRPATWQGAALYSGWASADIPLFLSAAGPRMLALAGETCDGIVFTGGVEPQRVRRALDEVAAAAVAAGRDPAGIQCWQLLRTSVRDDADHALDDIKPLLSSAFHNLRGDDPTIPDRVRPALSRMAERYDARQHVKPGPNVNVDLMEDLGLTEYLASRFGVYGTPASVADQLRSLAEAGVSRFIVPDVGALDPMITIRRFGLEVMPLCRGPAGLDDCRGRR